MTKKLKIYGLIASATCLFMAFMCSPQLNKIAKSAAQKPNILLIMADDMGFSDIGCYGGEIATPHIDRLAKEGTRLKQCYNQGICAPSRAALLTGQNPHKAGMGFFNQDLGLPAYQGFLNKESLTMAEVLKTGGYSTYLCGKWHVGNAPSQWALQRGFDKFFGFLSGAFGYFDDEPIIKNPPELLKLYEGNAVYKIEKKDFYFTDEMTDKAITYLKETPANKPFFLYMAYSSPHWPLHAKPTDIAKYKCKYDIGWDSFRTIRHQNLMKLGLIDPNWTPVKDKSLPAWNKLTYEEKRLFAAKMEVYAAMVDNLDQNIGRLLQHLETTKQLDNTLIVFVSDNGAEDWDFSKLPMAVNRSSGAVGTAGSNESYTINWAQVSAMPFRAYKASPYEGGVTSPFIARLPKVIPANSIQQGGIHFIDFLPSFMEVAGIFYPKTFNGTTPHPLQGESFITAIKNNQWGRKTPLCHEWAGHRAVWDGNWKLVSTYPANKWELYDLVNDRTESKDLAKEQPEIVQKLDAAYKNWAKNNAVVDWNEGLAKKTGFSK
jgi:arylsulfatase A-like enzyme